ncbi:hypothetical protein FHR22_002071 [Sphingopyxis panaciterrae]|nr:hypothetical protein [Sphingopyxis panaciterrae]
MDRDIVGSRLLGIAPQDRELRCDALYDEQAAFLAKQRRGPLLQLRYRAARTVEIRLSLRRWMRCQGLEKPRHRNRLMSRQDMGASQPECLLIFGQTVPPFFSRS